MMKICNKYIEFAKYYEKIIIKIFEERIIWQKNNLMKKI